MLGSHGGLEIMHFDIAEVQQAIDALDYKAARVAYLRFLRRDPELGLMGEIAHLDSNLITLVPLLNAEAKTKALSIILDFAFIYAKLEEFELAILYYQAVIAAYNKATSVQDTNDIKLRLAAFEGLIETQQTYGEFLELEASVAKANTFIAQVRASHLQLITSEIQQKIANLARLELISIDLTGAYRSYQIALSGTPQNTSTNNTQALMHALSVLGTGETQNNIPANYLRTRIFLSSLANVNTVLARYLLGPLSIESDTAIITHLQKFVGLLLNIDYGKLIVSQPEISRANFDRCRERFRNYKFFSERNEARVSSFLDHMVVPYINIIKNQPDPNNNIRQLVDSVGQVIAEYGAYSFSFNDFALALNYFELVLSWSKNASPKMHYDIGSCYMNLQQYAAALLYLQAACTSVDSTDHEAAIKYGLNLIITLGMLGRIAEAKRYCEDFIASQPTWPPLSYEAKENFALIQEQHAKLNHIIKAEKAREAGEYATAISLYEQVLTDKSQPVAVRLLYGASLDAVAAKEDKIIGNYIELFAQLVDDSLKMPFPNDTDSFSRAVSAYQQNLLDKNDKMVSPIIFLDMIYRPYLTALIIDFSLQSDFADLQKILGSINAAKTYYKLETLSIPESIREKIIGIISSALDYVLIFKLFIKKDYNELANELTRVLFWQPSSLFLKMAQAVVLTMLQKPGREAKIAELQTLFSARTEPTTNAVESSLITRYEAAIAPEADKEKQVELIRKLLQNGVRERLISKSQQTTVANLQEMVMAKNKQSTKNLATP